jgi:hypothetical protein
MKLKSPWHERNPLFYWAVSFGDIAHILLHIVNWALQRSAIPCFKGIPESI